MPTLTDTMESYVLQDRDLLLDANEHEYVLRVRDLPEPERPREKMLSAGPQDLNIAELVSVLWNVGTRREDVMSMARRTLREYGEQAVLNELNPKRLSEVAGIPLAKACQLVAGLELGRRYYARRYGKAVYVRNIEQASDYLKGMGDSTKEQLRGLYLNSRYQVVHDEVISVGSLTANIVHPREVYKPAIEHGAVAVIIAHNHPSGSTEPTHADLEVTSQLKSAGELLGISLLDHLIVTADDCVSIVTQNKNQEG